MSDYSFSVVRQTALFPGFDLARRLEAVECALAASVHGAESIPVAGGRAVFAGATSPLTHAVGLGMSGPVAESELDEVEEFFRSRGDFSVVELCPHADVSLVEALGLRGYRIVEFNNVLVRRPFVEDSPDPAVAVRTCAPDDRELWAALTARGFFSRDDVGTTETDIGYALFPSGTCLIAASNGDPLGAAAMWIHDSIAHFAVDSTLPAARNRGVQSALIRARLRMAVQAGCEVATASTLPGSPSQRNYERAGFQVAYTKVGLARNL